MINIFCKNSCLDCYYCAKAWRSPDDYQEKTFSLTRDTREKAKNSDFSFMKGTGTIFPYLKCCRGQWDEAISGTDVSALRAVLGRKKCRNFFSYKDGNGMLYSAAIEAQKVKSDRVMFWITTLGAITSTIAAVASIIALF